MTETTSLHHSAQARYIKNHQNEKSSRGFILQSIAHCRSVIDWIIASLPGRLRVACPYSSFFPGPWPINRLDLGSQSLQEMRDISPYPSTCFTLKGSRKCAHSQWIKRLRTRRLQGNLPRIKVPLSDGNLNLE